MLINKQVVKQLVHEKGYRISREGMMALDRKVSNLVDTAIRKLGDRKTITDVEVLGG